MYHPRNMPSLMKDVLQQSPGQIPPNIVGDQAKGSATCYAPRIVPNDTRSRVRNETLVRLAHHHYHITGNFDSNLQQNIMFLPHFLSKYTRFLSPLPP